MQNSLESSVKSTPVSSCSFRTLRHFTATAKGTMLCIKTSLKPTLSYQNYNTGNKKQYLYFPWQLLQEYLFFKKSS